MNMLNSHGLDLYYIFARPNDWLTVAANYGVPRPTAYRWASEDRDEELQRGDVRAASTKEATEIKSALESYLRENYQFTFGSPGLQYEYFNVYHQPPPPRPDLHPLSR
ncbi:hypothetical protein PC123_g12581 [Phytophthora cactorum]|nr:hypothetical protein PC123_g12581 [Phytophthora cactorum]